MPRTLAGPHQLGAAATAQRQDPITSLCHTHEQCPLGTSTASDELAALVAHSTQHVGQHLWLLLSRAFAVSWPCPAAYSVRLCRTTQGFETARKATLEFLETFKVPLEGAKEGSDVVSPAQRRALLAR